MKKFILPAIIAWQSICSFAQDTTKTDADLSFSLNADLVSRYVWRGQLLSPNVNIQPTAGISYKGFSLYTWGSYAFSDKYAEVDLILSYNIKNLTLSLNDYYSEIEENMGYNKYFNMSDTTAHLLEASASYIMAESFPLTLTAATFFYGCDKNADGKNNYSTYIELSYPLTYSEYSFNFFAGGTIGEGFYADKAALVNVGISASKDLKITDQYSLPLNISLVSNPHADDIFLTFKMTF